MTRYISLTKGQVSTIDFILSFTILLITLLFAIKIILTTNNASDFEDVQQKAIDASEILMSEGTPTDWNESYYIKLGLLTDNKLNQTKLDQVYGLGYNTVRGHLVEGYDMYMYFKNQTGIISLPTCGFGSPQVLADMDCNPQVSVSGNLIKMQRLVTYNNSIITMVVMVWD